MGAFMSCIHNVVFPAFDDIRPHKFTRTQVQLAEKYLPSFHYTHTSTAGHRQIAGAFWNEAFFEMTTNRSNNSSSRRSGNSQNNSRITQLYDVFYSYLDINSPQLKPVFRSSMMVRSKVLVHISAGMRNVLVGENLTEKVEALTTTHLRSSVRMEHYDPLGNALMFAMKECSGPLWTPEVEDAWRRLYTHCSVILLEAHKRAVDQRIKEAHEMARITGSSPNLGDIHSNHLMPFKENSVVPASVTSTTENHP